MSFLDDVKFDDIEVTDDDLEDAILSAGSLAVDYGDELFDSRITSDVFGYDEGFDWEA